MGRIAYLYAKVKHAWASNTLWERGSAYLFMMIRRPIEVLTGYARLSRADRDLELKEGFIDHRQDARFVKSNPEHLRRIIKAYKAAKQAQTDTAPPFKIRGLWAEWISVNYKKLIAALETENISDLADLLENLYREQYTIGTGGYDNWLHYQSLLGKFYIKYVWCKYRDKLLALDFDLQQITFPLVENPTGIVCNGNIVTIDALRQAYHAVEMRDLLRDVAQANIVEIGGGVGGQAYQAMQIAGKCVSKYLVFDIPEVAVVSSYFLLSAFPDKRIRLFGEGPVSVDPGEQYDAAVFPHFAIDKLADASVDLFYNSCSFSEMDGVSSSKYLSVVERVCRRYFLHDNHDAAFNFLNPDGSVSSNVIGSNLIPNSTWFKRIFKKPRVHGLPEDRYFIHFEYLYEKMNQTGQPIVLR